MKNDLTAEESKLAHKIYLELGDVSIARSKVILKEVERLIKEVVASIEEKKLIKEAEDV